MFVDMFSNEQLYVINFVGCTMEARLSAKRVVRGLTGKLVSTIPWHLFVHELSNEQLYAILLDVQWKLDEV